MSKAIEANYRETFLFPPAVEDWVGPDDPARFIREVVEALDLGESGLKEEKGGRHEVGRPHYSGSLLLKAWLYGYMNRIRSSRQLEKACRQQVQLIWLLGRQAPDHNTLWRFWKRHRKAVRKVFVQLVRIAGEADVAKAVLHAVDGTKIQGFCSKRGPAVGSREELEKRLEELEGEVERLEAEVAAREKSERGENGGRLPKELEDKKKLRERVRGAVDAVRESEAKLLSGSDPEARMMPCEGQKSFAYNAQAMVDGESGLVVAEQVDNEETDYEAFKPMLDATEENLGQVAGDTVADKGYRTDENLGEAARADRSVLVSLYKDEREESADPYHKSRFEYDAERDCCICPEGRRLEFEGMVGNRRGGRDRRYRCKVCADCPVAELCTGSAKGRSVRISPYEAEVREQRRRQSRREAQRKMARRKAIVEPVFGNIKHNQGFRRWTFRGLEKVQAQWAMLCTAHNLRKLHKCWAEGELSLKAA